MAGGVDEKKQQRPRKTAIRWPHKPEIPGSTPGAATTKKPAQRGFLRLRPMSTLSDILQAASNTAADTVSAPVDILAWLSRKAGIPVGNAPVGGSDWMRAQGIPGIRYLDGGSRGAGTGTSNYVVFPGEEELLKIIERNGKGLLSP